MAGQSEILPNNCFREYKSVTKDIQMHLHPSLTPKRVEQIKS